MCVRACLCTQVCGNPQRLELGPLESPVVVSPLLWVLGLQLWSSARAGDALNCWANSPALHMDLHIFLKTSYTESYYYH